MTLLALLLVPHYSARINTSEIVKRVPTLFRGYDYLIKGFNAFLPPAYRIECSGEAALTPINMSNDSTTQPISTAAAATSFGEASQSTVLYNGLVIGQELMGPIKYINKIKARFAHNRETYQKFLSIMNTYTKEQDVDDVRILLV